MASYRGKLLAWRLQIRRVRDSTPIMREWDELDEVNQEADPEYFDEFYANEFGEDEDDEDIDPEREVLEIEVPAFTGFGGGSSLFDSARRYIEQVDVYKEYQGDPTTRRPNTRRGRGPRNAGSLPPAYRHPNRHQQRPGP